LGIQASLLIWYNAYENVIRTYEARKWGRDSPIAWRGSVRRTAEYGSIAFAANDATDGRD
jgi:hypothetical protein